jgi:hypothetical protein
MAQEQTVLDVIADLFRDLRHTASFARCYGRSTKPRRGGWQSATSSFCIRFWKASRRGGTKFLAANDKKFFGLQHNQADSQKGNRQMTDQVNGWRYHRETERVWRLT